MIKALIVEDDQQFAQALAERLLSRGMTLSFCDNSTSAIERLVSDRFDYVFIDLMLPPNFREEGICVLRQVLRYQGEAIPFLISQREKTMIPIVNEARDLGARYFFDENDEFLLNNIMAQIELVERERKNGIFLSHGHNELIKLKLKDFIESRLRRREVVLSEQPKICWIALRAIARV
jgi:CheY-like chemotaxis protein